MAPEIVSRTVRWRTFGENWETGYLVRPADVGVTQAVVGPLDAERQARLLEVVSDCQTFVTCTHLEEFVKAGAVRMQVYRVSNGRVVEE